MNDQLVRAISRDGMVKAVAVSTRDLTERARQIHRTLPVATAALGRTLAAGPVTELLRQGLTPEELLGRVLSDFELEILERTPVEYRCYCSRERMERALISLGPEELESMIAEQGGAELTCRFCDNVQRFSREELEGLLRGMRRR